MGGWRLTKILVWRLSCRVEMYEGEGHGFRRAESRKRAMESELKFYWKTFGIKGGEL